MAEQDILDAVENAEVVEFPTANQTEKQQNNKSYSKYRVKIKPEKNVSLPPRKGTDIDDFNEDHAVVLVENKVFVLYDSIDANSNPDVRFLTPTAFKELWGNCKHKVVKNVKDPETGDVTDTKVSYVSATKRWLESSKRRQFAGVVFAPEGAPNGFYNLWKGFSVEPKEGDCSIFLDHIMRNVCQDDERLFDWVMAWFAQIVQNPEKKTGTSLVLRGKQGAGKTKPLEIIGSLFPQHYCLAANQRYLTGQFNAHLVSCLLLQIDEGFWAGAKDAAGVIKDLVTSHSQMIEKKGVDPTDYKNLVRLAITSNNDWVIPADFEERRFGVLDVGEGNLQDAEFFKSLDRQMDNGGREALLYHLLNLDISNVNLRQPPATEALFEQKIKSLPPEYAWWYDCLSREFIFAREQEWESVVAIENVRKSYMNYADDIGVKRKMSETSLGKLLNQKLAPGIKVVKRSVEIGRDKFGEPIEGRRRCYEFPELDECRKHFAELVNFEVPWGDGIEEKEGMA